MNQIFQIVPSATLVASDKLALASEVTAKGGVYNKAGYFALDGSGALFVKNGILTADLNAGTLPGLQAEMVVSFPAIPEAEGGLMVKDGTVCLGISSFKFKTGWVKGFSDAYNASTDQVFGLEQLLPNVKYTLRWSYDAATGMVVMTINSRLDRKRYRFQGAGLLNFTNSTWQFFRGVKANVYSVSVWTGKPNLVNPGMECYVVDRQLKFRKIDPGMKGAEIRVVIESPFGASANMRSGILNVTADFDWLIVRAEELDGLYTLHITATLNGKTVWQDRKQTAFFTQKVNLPTGIVKGLYHVNRVDFDEVAALGARYLYCDFTVQNNTGGWLEWPNYLSDATHAGVKLIVPGNFQAKKTGTFPMAANHPAMAGWYAVDEAAGSFDRLRTNYLACKMEYPTQPVIVDLNNFTRIEEAAECADILMVNVYLSAGQDRRKITDVVRKAAQYRPVHLVLPLYSSIQTGTDDLKEMARLGIEAGATGIWIFEFDHRSTAKPGDWYIGNQPEVMQRIKDVFASI